MTGEESFALTPRDHAILEGIALHRPLARQEYFALLRRKLTRARVAQPDDEPFVALDCTVHYRIDEGELRRHRLVLGPTQETLGETVSVRSLYGLGLIGLFTGQSIEVEGFGGRRERLRVEDIELSRRAR